MLGGVEGLIPRQILRCCVVIKALVDKSTEEQLVGMKSQVLKGTMQEIDGKPSGVESVVGMLKGASILDHL